MYNSEEKRTKAAQSPVDGYPPSYGYYPQEDEIRLIDLWNALVKRKITILVCTMIVTMGAIVYALTAPFVYRAEVVFLPPTASDIQELNFQGVHEIDTDKIQRVSVETVYSVFRENLSSRAPRQAVFKKMNLIKQFAPQRTDEKHDEAIFEDFNKGFSVALSNLEEEGQLPVVTLAMEGNSPELIAEILNKTADETLRFTVNEIVTNIETEIDVQKKDLQRQIELLRGKAKSQRLDEILRMEKDDELKRKTIEDQIKALRILAKQKRQDRIAMLKEAAIIAHSLGIKDPIDYKLKKINAASPDKPQIMTNITTNNPQLYKIESQDKSKTITTITTHDPQLYRIGFEAIEAEIKSLSDRKSDDPFISELRNLQLERSLLEHNRESEQLKARKDDDPFIETLPDKRSKLELLNSIKIDPSFVKPARLDQAAYPPENRIKPKRKKIVAIGFLLGLMLGVVCAFLSSLIEKQRKEQVKS